MPSITPDYFINAVRFSDIEKVKSLLAQGADPNAKDGLGNTALLYVARRMDGEERAQLLLDKGARIDETSVEGNTPLILASRDNNVKMVRFLLAKGASLDIKNRSGYTALGVAESWGHAEIMRILREAAETRKKLTAERAQRDAEKARADAAHTLAAERQKRLKQIGPKFRPK